MIVIIKKNQEEPKVTRIDEKTIYIDGIGKVTEIGEFNMKKFIEVAMSLPSFWENVERRIKEQSS